MQLSQLRQSQCDSHHISPFAGSRKGTASGSRARLGRSPPTIRPGEPLNPRAGTPPRLFSTRRCSSASSSFVLARSAASELSNWTPPTRRGPPLTRGDKAATPAEELPDEATGALDRRELHGCANAHRRHRCSPAARAEPEYHGPSTSRTGFQRPPRRVLTAAAFVWVPRREMVGLSRPAVARPGRVGTP